jgi:hypothetical protein
VSVTLSPSQKVVAPLGVIDGAGGIGLTVTEIGIAAALVQFDAVTLSV